MVRRLEVLAIIPARGGSRSIPRKNIRNFAGYPLLLWSITAAKESKYVTRVIVSTDDEKMAKVARKSGAETPFLRPSKYAGDNSTDLAVFVHALKWLAKHEGYQPDIVVQLRPTSPIRPRGIVDKAVKVLLAHPKADSVRGVVAAGQNPYKMWRLTGENAPMKSLLDVKGIDEPYNAPRQLLPQIYWQTGHIDAIRPATILKGSMSGKNIYPLVIDPRFTVDIDNLRDWERYEHIVKTSGLDMIRPGPPKRPLPKGVQLLILDFDGVLTDNRVRVDSQGRESVVFSRSDGLGIARLKEIGVDILVLSTEANPVVAARCRKLGLPFKQGLKDKATALREVLASRKLDPGEVVYVGNDLNDLACFPLVGCAVAVADAVDEVLQAADIILSQPGGHGAVRELCDILIRKKALS